MFSGMPQIRHLGMIAQKLSEAGDFFRTLDVRDIWAHLIFSIFSPRY